MLSDPDHSFALANPDVVFEEFDGEYVILDLASGTYHAVDGSASVVWNLLMEGVSPSNIAKGLNDNRAVGSNVVVNFVEKLVEQGLLKASGEVSSKLLAQSARDALNKLDTPPATEVFDDLADLILSDPIHDVDETAGWPVRPTDG